MIRRARIKVIILSGVLMTGLLLSGCGQASSAGGSEQSTIKIGVSTVLSPPGDVKGGQINLNTIKLAQKEINTQGGVNGKQIDLVVGDDSGDTAKGVSLVQKFVSEDKVSAIVGVWQSNVALAQSQVASQAKVPLLIHYSWTDDATKMHSDYVFRVGPYNSEIGKLLMPFFQQNNYKKVVALVEDTSLGTGAADAIKSEADKLGIDVTSIVFPQHSMDLSPQLLQIKNLNPDIIYFQASYEPRFIIPKQANEVGIKTPILAGWDYPASDPDFWKNVGNAGKGVEYVGFYSPQLNLTSLGKHFRDAYKQEYKEDPPIYAYYQYDAMMMLADTMKKIGSSDPQKLAAALKTEKFDGTTGKIEFTSNSQPGPVWNQWLGHQLFVMKLNNVGDNGDKAEQVYPKK